MRSILSTWCGSRPPLPADAIKGLAQPWQRSAQTRCRQPTREERGLQEPSLLAGGQGSPCRAHSTRSMAAGGAQPLTASSPGRVAAVSGPDPQRGSHVTPKSRHLFPDAACALSWRPGRTSTQQGRPLWPAIACGSGACLPPAIADELEQPMLVDAQWGRQRTMQAVGNPSLQQPCCASSKAGATTVQSSSSPAHRAAAGTRRGPDASQARRPGWGSRPWRTPAAAPGAGRRCTVQR